MSNENTISFLAVSRNGPFTHPDQIDQAMANSRPPAMSFFDRLLAADSAHRAEQKDGTDG